MKILFVINSFGTGGAENQVVSLISELSRRGHSCCVVRLKNKPDDLTYLLNDNHLVTTHHLGMDSKLGMLVSVLKYNAFVKDFRPDVVHAHLSHSIIFSRLYKFLFSNKTRIICTTHSYNIRNKLIHWMYKKTDFISDINTNVSQAAVNRYIETKAYSKEKSLSIPNGFDIDKYSSSNKCSMTRSSLRSTLGFSQYDFVCCAVGRLDSIKNYEMMIETIHRVYESKNCIRLIILGGGSLLEPLKSLVSKFSLNEKVKFVGIKKNVSDYLFMSDMFLMTSNHEGMPLALCEAMLSGLPVLSTRFEGAEEFILNDHQLVDKNDSKSLSEKIISFIDGKFIIDAESDRIRIEKQYSISSVVDRWEDIYKNYAK